MSGKNKVLSGGIANGEYGGIRDPSPLLANLGLLQFLTSELQVKSMTGVDTTVISPEVAAAYYGLGVRMMKESKLEAAK